MDDPAIGTSREAASVQPFLVVQGRAVTSRQRVAPCILADLMLPGPGLETLVFATGVLYGRTADCGKQRENKNDGGSHDDLRFAMPLASIPEMPCVRNHVRGSLRCRGASTACAPLLNSGHDPERANRR